MNSVIRIPLHADAEQHQRLLELQREFARACNAVAPLVQETRTWNRVALHHLAYRKLRDAFPGIGSQMACNAIYSVSRTARLVFQSPGSPFHHTQLVGKPMPRLQFLDTAPVYFDRHTLSIKQGLASMYTLDGRMKFQLALLPEQEAAFHQRKLLEASLQRRGEVFELQFTFGPASAVKPLSVSSATAPSIVAAASPSLLEGVEPSLSALPGTDSGPAIHEAAPDVGSRMPPEESEAPLRAPVHLPPYLNVEAFA